MLQVFGKNVKIRVSVLADREIQEPYELVGARVYSDSPSEAQIEDSGDSLAASALTEATSWTEDGNEFEIAFGAALTDSDEHSTRDYEKYYLVANFRFESGGSEKFIVKPFLVFRPTGLLSRISVTPEMLEGIDSDFTTVKSHAWASQKIDAAIQHVLIGVRAKGLEREGIVGESLNQAVLYWAAFMSYMELDEDMDRAEKWEDRYEKIWDQLKIDYDADGDGVAEPSEARSVGGPVAILA
jgi:hypothetical protein